MLKEGKFGVQEAVCLATVTISTKIFFTSPAFLTNFVGTAGWETTFISNMITILAFTFILKLLKRFPGKDIIEIFNLSLGKIIGFVVSLIFTAAFLLTAGILMREFTDVIKTYVYRETPAGIIIGFIVIAVSIAAYLGLETIARVSKLTAYIMLVSYFILLILAAQNYRFTNLFPILGYGIDKTILHGIRRSSAYDEILMLAVFAGSLQGIKHIKKAGYLALVFSGFLIIIGILCFTLAFPLQTAQELTAPIYVLSRAIKYGSFFQRLDTLFLFLWIFASLIATSALFYCSLSCYCKTFRLNDSKPFVPLMAILLFTLAMLPKDFSSVVEGQVQLGREYGWLIFYAIPILTWFIAIIRRKKGEERNA